MDQLIKTTLADRFEGLQKFVMFDFEVDGIEYKNPRRTFDTWMVSFKDEFDEDQHPDDVGPKFIWQADKEVSEKHWLSCNLIIEKGYRCTVCEEIAD